MSRAGMTRWGGRHTTGTEGSDDVQKSLELLDKVLSEFDDLENGNLGRETGEGVRARNLRATGARTEFLETTGKVSTTPEDDSPSLGHQSEDDGYMSMNGSRAKFVLSFRPVLDEGGHGALPPAPDPPPDPPPQDIADFPPPPEEAERIISNLLPKLSPVNTHQRLQNEICLLEKPFLNSRTSEEEMDRNIATATQTTLPKTRHQRPFGWEHDSNQVPPHLHLPLQPQNKCSSLPYDGALHHSRYPPPWLQKPGPLPPRTLAGALDRHREVKRQISKDNITSRICESDSAGNNPANFSDDSLEESVPPVTKRRSVSWEVPLGFEDEDSYLTPGSTKVIGRRRKKSAEHSSNGSIHRLSDEWPDPPPRTEDEIASPYSDSFYDSNDAEDLTLAEALPLDLTFNGTYVIRKGRKKENTSPFEVCALPREKQSSLDRKMSQKSSELKRTSSTFDNIKSLLRERAIEGLNEPPPDFVPPHPPKIVRVVSLPDMSVEKADVPDLHSRNSKCERFSKLNELGVTPEEAEEELSSLDNPSLIQELDSHLSCESETVGGFGKCDEGAEISPSQKKQCVEVETQTDLSDTETQNELQLVGEQIPEISKTKSELDEVEKKIQEIVKIKTVMEKQAREEDCGDPWVRATDVESSKMAPVPENKLPNDFLVNVEVLQHEFGPLPPSPVDEDDEDYEDSFHAGSAQAPRANTDALPEPLYRCQDSTPCDSPPAQPPPSPSLSPSLSPSPSSFPSPPPPPPLHRTSESAPTNSIFRSMEIGFSRASRAQSKGSRNESTTERRTLPSEFPGPVSRRRTFQKRSSTLPSENSQTSCSLPETPIFSRGCDIPRTPHRRAPDAIRPGGLQSSNYCRNGVLGNSICNTAYKHSLSGGLNQAMVGAELLRLAGGPGRGWYPRHRQHRPASIEQLDRLPHSDSAQCNGLLGPVDFPGSRKPMTLPPNITPRFFHRSPRDALRRVTSLLIRGKGLTSKEKKEVTPPTTRFGDPAEQPRQKKGFWNFWKRSRHYSLDHQ